MIAAKGGAGKIDWTPEEIAAHERQERPWFTAMAHVSIPVRDLEEAKRFYTEVLGGRLILNLPEFAEVMLAGMIVGFSAHKGRPQAADTEFPHIAFYVASDSFVPMKSWLEEHGVRTHEIWTRNGREGLMYFKDPSGNLFEIYCSAFDGADLLPRGGARGGESVVDLTSLNYEWHR